MNTIVNDALKKAMSAVHHLDAQGSTVFAIEVKGGRPVIRIDGQHGQFLTGAMKRRQRDANGQMRVSLVASVHGCLVEWNELYEAPRRGRRA